MKKLDSVSVAFCCFLIAAIIIITYGIVIASPFVISDPQADADKYRIRLSSDNGQTWGAWVEGSPVNGAMRFDIAGIPAGNYRGEAQAGGTTTLVDSTTGVTSTVFAWSDAAPFVLNVKTGQKVLNIRIIE